MSSEKSCVLGKLSRMSELQWYRKNKGEPNWQPGYWPRLSKRVYCRCPNCSKEKWQWARVGIAMDAGIYHRCQSCGFTVNTWWVKGYFTDGGL